jgi:hypothetical protein
MSVMSEPFRPVPERRIPAALVAANPSIALKPSSIGHTDRKRKARLPLVGASALEGEVAVAGQARSAG